jgi:hypothetical protein
VRALLSVQLSLERHQLRLQRADLAAERRRREIRLGGALLESAEQLGHAEHSGLGANGLGLVELRKELVRVDAADHVLSEVAAPALVTARALHSRSFVARRDPMHARHETAHDDRLLAAPLLGAQNLLRLRCGWLQRCGRLFCTQTLHLDGFQCLVESLEQGLSHILAVVAAAERG